MNNELAAMGVISPVREEVDGCCQTSRDHRHHCPEGVRELGFWISCPWPVALDDSPNPSFSVESFDCGLAPRLLVKSRGLPNCLGAAVGYASSEWALDSDRTMQLKGLEAPREPIADVDHSRVGV